MTTREVIFALFLEDSHSSRGLVLVKISDVAITYITSVRQAFDSAFGNVVLVESKIQISSVYLLRFLESHEDQDLEGLFRSGRSCPSAVVYFKRKIQNEGFIFCRLPYRGFC